MCKYPVFMALVLLERGGRFVPRLLWGRRAPFLPGDHPPPQLHPQAEGQGDLLPANGAQP